MTLPDILSGLHAVIAARISSSGILIEANAGFLKLLPATLHDTGQVNVNPLFIQPTFANLITHASKSEGFRYNGLLNMGKSPIYTQSLQGGVFC